MKALFPLALLMLIAFVSSGQSLGDRVLNKTKQRANRKIDRTIDKGLDKVEKGVDESVSTDKKKDDTTAKESKTQPPSSKDEIPGQPKPGSDHQNKFEAYTKFDFVPGTKILFLDDFNADHVGDFPARWNTNGSGEVVSTGDNPVKWFEMKPSSIYVPNLEKKLPEDYTVEFDLMTSGIDKKTSSTAKITVMLDDNTLFNPGKNFARVEIPLAQFVVASLKVQNKVNGAYVINNDLKPDLRQKVLNGMHISIAVTGRRFRLWADEEKIVDLPTFIPKGTIQTLKFELRGFANDFKTGRVFVGNFKLAEGGLDLRSKLISEGKLSTTAITFDVNSDRLKPESMGIIKEIAEVLKANPDVKIKIIGHTDADGDDAHNLALSKSRAAAVKSALETSFAISGARIETDGKGETQPVAGNDTSEGKAANRRVDFIKL